MTTLASTSADRSPGLSAVVHSEWIKLMSLRSSWITLIAAAAVMVLIGAVAAGASGDEPVPGQPVLTTDDPLATVMTGASLAVVILGVLGCLTGAREHTSRMITTTFIATPRRARVVAAKVVVLSAAVVPTAVVGTLGAFTLGMGVLDAGGAPTVGLADDGVARELAGMVLWLWAVSILGLGLGLLLRSVAASIGVLVAIVLVAPAITGVLLPDSAGDMLQVLPSNAAAAFTAVQSSADITWSAGAGVAVVAAWTLGAVLLGLRSTLRRDV